MTDRSRDVRPPRALIVDDDPVIRLLAGRALEGVGFAIDEAESGREAVKQARRAPPDLVVLDLVMPGDDGFETCRKLRALREMKEVPILVTTGLTDAATIDRVYETGASEFINKPIDWLLFQHRVRFLMRAHGAFRDLSRTLGDLWESRQRLASAHRIARIGHYDLDSANGEMLWSAELQLLLALPATREPPDLPHFLALVHPQDRAAVEKGMQQSGASGEWILEHRMITSAGAELVVCHQSAPSSAPHGEGRIEGAIQDISEQRRSEERLRFLAYYDPLTQLPNRNHLRERLQRALARGRHTGETVALLCLDLDRFHRINDTLGQTMGDELLRQTAMRLRECVRATDFLGRPSEDDGSDLSRLGGDEFTVLLSDVGSEQDVRAAAHRLLRAFEAPFDVRGRSIPMDASVGIAISSAADCDAEHLLQWANLATTRAKRGEGHGICVYESAMNAAAEQRFELENALRCALERREFAVSYQPLVDARDARIRAVEALLRWRHPVHGNVSPAVFVPVAESLGLIGPIGAWVLDEACRQARAWRERGHPELRVSVNVSSLSFDRDLVETVTSALARHGLPPEALDLELTESGLLDEPARAIETMRRLREIGVGVALDDFGTGYSSLSRLVELPISTIKIDRAFVSQIGGSGSAVIGAMISLARHLRVEIVAEGVETLEQEAFLRAEGCTLLQGFRYSIASPRISVCTS
ncbi:MAG: EAL domain-containing protein [Deltaproteobacteria bacterium]|nr:MAG: EAL domain-containing protein [Deltaproteobacteria bacterium]